MHRRYSHLVVSSVLIFISIILVGQMFPTHARSAAITVNDIIVVPRNYIFTWGSSGQNIDANNTVYCSSNPDFWQVLYWRTSDTNASAGVNDWNPDVLVAGDYDLYVYIPDYTHSAAITTQAKYYLDGSLLATLDQNQNKCQWVHIGRRWLNAGTGHTIAMPAQTSDNPYRLIAGDGLKLVYVPPPTYSISGRVADTAGNPFSGVTITTDKGQSASTDGSGNFSLANLAAGTYTLTPSSGQGYTFSPATRTVTVAPSATGQNFTVTNRYSISGKLADTAGNPIPGVNVVCQGISSQKTVTSDSSGNYACSNLVPGIYLVRPNTAVYPFSPRARGWMLVPPNSTNQDFTTAPVYGSISGQVTREGAGSPVANASVNVAGKATQTDISGNYTISGLLPGSHVLRVTANSYQDYQQNVTIQVNVNTVANVVLKPVLVDGYRLPFPGGTRYRLSNTAHPSGYAQDWTRYGMNADDIVASRAGKVVYVKESSNSGGWDNKYLGKENYVIVRHADRTDTYYVHLRQWSVPVNVGDYVRSGQVIGKSGLTGKTSGEHLHFAWMVNGKRAVPNFLDVAGGVPQVNGWYTSGNYLTSLLSAEREAMPQADTTAPVGSFRFRLTGQPTYQVQVDAFDYDSDTLQMRTATDAQGLSSAAWVPAAESIDWTAPIVWGQFKDEAGNVSSVYSDTIESIAYEPIQAAFSVEPTVCAGYEPVIQNQTFPLCEQCGWQWDYGDGNSSPLAQPALPYLTAVYTSTGAYTITLTVSNIDSASTVAHPIEVLATPSAEFTITRLENMITVKALEQNAASWLWDFGDGTTVMGQQATHIYAGENTLESSVITLNVQSSNGCSSLGYLAAPQAIRIYLPVINR